MESFKETALPLRPEYSDRLKLFSAKDAKDAKCFWIVGFGGAGSVSDTLNKNGR